MDYKISDCEQSDAQEICDRLVEYNLSKVPKTQTIAFQDISKKMIDNENNLLAGCVARMYCWNVVYVDIYG